jgi:FKBP-type peptidyl-prolyl isomerase-like protein
MRNSLAMAAALLALAALAGCGGESMTTVASHPPPTGDWRPLQRYAGTAAPHLVYPNGSPPKKVEVEQLQPGTGTTLAADDWFAVRYISFDYANGEIVENHWQEPFEWVYGRGEIVKGWEPGLRGMKVGELRELLLPSRFAYHAGPRIYLVKLLKVEP